MDIERVRGVISQMKLQEKLALTGGGRVTASVDRLRVPAIDMGDSLDPYYADEPTALALGCTFSHTVCAAVSGARSAAAVRAHEAFSGTIGCGLIQDPMRPDACGLFSEDPYLTAELLGSYASAGALGYVFTDALGQGRFQNRTVDLRALYEHYLYPLEKAGRHAAALQLDGGYINGEQVATSRNVAEKLSGYIPQYAMMITQSGKGGGPTGINGGGAYQLGSDPSDKKAIARAVVDGKMFENKLNTAIERTVAAVARTHEIYKAQPPASAAPVNIVIDSTVLLKNDGILPISSKSITIFGDPEAFNDGLTYRMLPIKDAPKKYGTLNLIFVTDYDGNGLKDADSAAICAAGAAAPVIVVICGGAAAELPIEKSANAIMYCPYCPTVSAVIAMLTSVSPRGHLPFTWMKYKKSYPRNNEKYKSRGDFRYESMYSGYRLFNNYDAGEVMYPFGHGLDYAKYEVSRFAVSSEGLKISAEFVIKNTSEIAGSALCQIYLTPIGAPVYGLEKRLVAFKRVALEPTENARVAFTVNLGDFQVYDPANDSFAPLGGKYRVDMGLSSVDIRASAEIKVAAGSRVSGGLNESLAPSYYKAGKRVPFEPTAPEIERLLKVPFIKKPDEYPDIRPPDRSAVKSILKRAERSVQKRLLPLVRYRIENTPL